MFAFWGTVMSANNDHIKTFVLSSYTKNKKLKNKQYVVSEAKTEPLVKRVAPTWSRRSAHNDSKFGTHL